MTAPDKELVVPDLIGTGIEATVKLASQLGLTWKMRLATVIEVRNVNQMLIKVDGDENGLLVATSMIGLGYYGQRVYVISVPPAGNYIVGAASFFHSGERIATTVRATNSVGFTTTEQLTDTVTGNLIKGLIYKVSFFGLLGGTVAGDSMNVRIREDSGITGTQLQGIRYSISVAGTSLLLVAETEYQAVATQAKTFSFTGQRITGSGTITHNASAVGKAYFYIDFDRYS